MGRKRTVPTIEFDRLSYLWLVIGTLLGLLWHVPLAWWLAPIFLLRFMRTQPVGRGFLLVWLSSFVTASVAMYDVLNSMIPMPLPIYLAIMAAITVMVGGLPYLADRLIAQRLPGFAGTCVLPLAMTTVDYIGSRANPMGGVTGYAYLQYGNIALMQLASITGMWGITFLVFWLGPVVNWAWEREFAWRRIRRGTAAYAGIVLVVLLYGGARVGYAPEPSGTVRMHGFTAVDMRQKLSEIGNARNESWQAFRDISAELQDLYLKGTVREAQAGAELVHWPEMGVILAKEDEADFVARGQEVARQEGIYLAMSLVARNEDSSPSQIKLIVVDPAGDLILEHPKYATLLDGAAPGDGVLRTADTPFGTLSGVICNDTYHEEVVAQAGRNGTDILLSPSLEFRGTDPLQAHMAIFRAIENGVTVVRQADNGLSFVADPYGRIVAAVDHWSASEWVTVAQVPVGVSPANLYPYIGDLFAWLALAGFAALAVWAIIRARGASRAPSAA